MSNAADNAEVVCGGHAAFKAADLGALGEIFDASATWHTPGRSSISGDSRGREAAFALFGRCVGETRGTFKATLRDVFASGNGRVIGLHRNTGERMGKKFDVNCCIVFEVKDGRIVDSREHFFDLHAWDEFWS